MKMAKLEAAMRVVLAYVEAFNRHDLDGMMALTSEYSVYENTFPAPDGERFAGREAIAAYWQAFLEQSPHARLDIEEIFGFGRRCVLRWRYDWIDEAGQAGHVRGVDIYRVENDLITEKLSYVKG